MIKVDPAAEQQRAEWLATALDATRIDGEVVRHAEPLMGGVTSLPPYRLTLASGRNVVIKFSGERTHIEADVLRSWVPLGIPAAVVREVGTLVGESPVPYLVLDVISGRCLRNVVNELHGQVAELATLRQKMAVLQATINQQRGVGFDRQPRFGNGTWTGSATTLRESFTWLPETISVAQLHGLLIDQDLAVVEHAVCVLEADVVRCGSRLVHGDWHTGNLMIDEQTGSLTVLDPGGILTHPAMCLGLTMALNEPWLEADFAAYVSAYRSVEDIDERAIAAGTILMILALFRYWPSAENIPATKERFARCRVVLFA